MPERTSGSVTQQETKSILGNLDDASIAAILEVGPGVKELEEAMAWASGESEVMGELERPLDGAVARVYDILTQDEAWLETDHSRSDGMEPESNNVEVGETTSLQPRLS